MRGRLPRIATAVALLAGSSWAATACAPPPTSPLTSHYFNPTLYVIDRLGNVAMRLKVHETVVSTPTGYITADTGTQDQQAVGILGIIGTVEAIPEGANGYTGVWAPTRTFTARWHLQEDFTAFGLGWHVSKGDCVLTGYIASFANSFSLSGVTSYCSDLNSRAVVG